MTPLWVDHRGRALGPEWLYQMVKRLGERAGIPDLHTHRFRHTFAMNALRSGMPERVLELIGGWERIPDTYLRTLDAGDAAEFHRQMSQGDRVMAQQSAPRSSRGRGHPWDKGQPGGVAKGGWKPRSKL